MNRLTIIALIVGVVIGISGGYSIVQLQLNDVRSTGEELQVEFSRSSTLYDMRSSLFIVTLSGREDLLLDTLANIEGDLKGAGSDYLNAYYDRLMTDIRSGTSQTFESDFAQFMDQLAKESTESKTRVEELIKQIKG
tara:strand:- start:346 stop:756 length:411 start_codon:yes stop_codon:yes gene_type:complete